MNEISFAHVCGKQTKFAFPPPIPRWCVTYYRMVREGNMMKTVAMAMHFFNKNARS